jgi:type III secretion protein N (ATPase)
MGTGDDAPVLVEIAEALQALDKVNPLRVAGRVQEVTGLVMRATIPAVRVGELVYVDVEPLPGEEGGQHPARLQAEVVGFRGDDIVLMPLGPVAGIGPDAVVSPTGRSLSIRVGEGLLGRVLGGLGEPIDGGGEIAGSTEEWPVERPAPDPLRRQRIRRPLALGVRAIDGLVTVGEGQRVGLFAGTGVGKSVLLGQIARNTEADVNVICLVGERGRETAEFLEDNLGELGRARSVVVCVPSDAPALVRLKSAFVATAIAEWFRERGQRVLLLMDSLTRFARAQREVGLAAGEPPVRHGFPPSVFGLLPRLLERAGNSERGTLTALYTVLVAGDDLEEPVADEARAILDGHIVLSRALGERNHWPAIDVLASLSRVMDCVVDAEHRQAAGRVRELLAGYEQKRDLILLGAYQPGSDPRTDAAIAKQEVIATFLRQARDEKASFAETRQRLLGLC